ncbi:universal stress protein [Edaphobacter sp. DSM 109919]|uniref:Universal stress protein n=1 Tax=Edaphobacter paludis TaxID=3035702 RepID=A0AAU7D286_9BACT
MITSAPAQITFERILIPTDFSDVSGRAIEYGKSIATRYNAQILLTHVNQQVHSAPPIDEGGLSNAIQQAIEQQLEQEGAELRSEGFHVRTISVTGKVQEEVLSAVNREKADLVVLGTHGETGIERLLFGSDAEALLRNSPCPVLVIGPVTQSPSNLAWHPSNIVCASDLNPDTATIAAYAYMIAREFQAAFTLLHVQDPVKKEKKSDLQLFEKAFEHILPDQPSPIVAFRNMSPGNAGFAIVDFATDRNADLIVMGAHTASSTATHLMRGLVPQIITDTPCPVLIIHKQGHEEVALS